MQQTGDGPPGDDDYYDSVEEESIRVLAAAATPTQLPGTRRRNRGLGGRSSSTVQQQLVVPGQLLPPGERPADMEELLSPLAVIPPQVRSYAQAATSSPLDGADWVYVAKGGGASGPWRTSTVAPTRYWSRPTKLGRSRWARKWRSSAGTTSSHTWAGSCGSPAAHTWEAEDGLYIFCGLSCFSEEARGPCVADEFYSNKSMSLCV